tara:strand:- start:42 stop:587 length:546 start_codon:yes stop_codon:yes gene_type:complete
MIEIQQKSDYYKAYIDSVIKLKPVKSYPNWTIMSTKNDSLKNEVIKVSKELKKDDAINLLIENASHTFDTFKISSIKTFKKLNSVNAIKELQREIFKTQLADLEFKNVSEDTILKAFMALDEYTKNKNELSRNDWNHLYIIYQALDVRKRQILNEIHSFDVVEINKIQPKIFALIKLNTIF